MKLVDLWMRDITSICGLPIIGFIFLFLIFFNKIILAKEFIVALIISEILIWGIRFFYFRQRPYGKKDGFKNLYERIDESSFPSIHASRAFIIAFVLSQGLGIYMKILFWSIALLICVSRIYLKRHHISDVVVGAILGLIISYIVTIFGGFI